MPLRHYLSNFAPTNQTLCNMKRKYIIVSATVAAMAAGIMAWCTLLADMRRAGDTDTPYYIYIDTDDNADSVRIKSGMGWRWKAYSALMTYKPRTGCYRIEPGDKALNVYRALRNGAQTPIMLTVPQARTMERLAGRLAGKLMLDSAEIAGTLRDSAACGRYGFTTATVPALFVPNTYEVYWDMSVNDLLGRMKREHNAFWNEERRQKAEAMGMTETEVATLASIVDEETADNGEKPAIAGMYINRLRIGMPLQADPTVKFAVGDFALRRIYNEHLKTDSPYNTYRNTGLPPGPICIPSIAGIDAVLNYTKHDYLYMCAKEDFSGTHNFAATYSEHLKNARRYIKALNNRNIR